MGFLRRSGVVLFGLSLPIFAGSSVQSIHNFYQVDKHVYRGAQPDEEGFQYLAKIGVKTVVDLRASDGRSQEEQKLVAAAGMNYVHVPMTGLTPPTDDEITKVLGILEDSSTGPVFVHCKRGADRTGTVIAAYRIDHDSWDNAKALSEAMSFRMSSLQFPRMNYIRTFQHRTVQPQANAGAAALMLDQPAVAALP